MSRGKPHLTYEGLAIPYHTQPDPPLPYLHACICYSLMHLVNIRWYRSIESRYVLWCYVPYYIHHCAISVGALGPSNVQARSAMQYYS